MDSRLLAAGLLIAVPLAFNGAFLALGRAFDYLDTLRKEPGHVLWRFSAGGPGLVLRWEALLLSALAMLPLAVVLSVATEPPSAHRHIDRGGSAAAPVQALGLVGPASNHDGRHCCLLAGSPIMG